MPRYIYACDRCQETFEEWQPMAAPAFQNHPGECGGRVFRVIQAVNTMGVGRRGARTRQVDKTERQWSKDMPAYERLRMEGHQPVGIDGAHRLEAEARDDWYIKTGGHVSVPEHRRAEVDEMLADGGVCDWDPVEQVHANKGAA